MLGTHAQNYLVGFAGTGDTTAIETIMVYNLTSGDTVILNGGDILQLKAPSGVESGNIDVSPLQLYPNPMGEKSLLTFRSPGKSNMELTISDISGKVVGTINTFLPQGINVFSISGLLPGIYLVKVSGQGYLYSAKLVSKGNSASRLKILFISNESSQVLSPKHPKNTAATIEMPYTTGDLLLYKSTSGQYSTVVTDVPTGSKTITFQFTGCRDSENHTYSTVQVGTQLWMAQNLNMGARIQDTTNEADNGLIEKHCYENKESNCDIYGGLYQWGEMMNYDTTPGAHGICPAGWHIPADSEWTTLNTYLGGESIAAGKMKETGSGHWAWPNTAATNESGFTALPGGYSYYSGTLFITDYATFWSSSEAGTTNAWYRLLQFNYEYITRRSYTKANGYSVRCLKN